MTHEDAIRITGRNVLFKAPQIPPWLMEPLMNTSEFQENFGEKSPVYGLGNNDFILFAEIYKENALDNEFDSIVREIEGSDWLKGSQVPEVILGWVAYVIVMLVATFFKEKIPLYFIITIIWVLIRAYLIAQASSRYPK